MNNDNNLLKINNSIHNLFVSIRTDSKQKSIIEILNKYIEYSKLILEGFDIQINSFIKDIKAFQDFYFIEGLINEIKQNINTSNYVDLKWIKYNFNIYIDVFIRMIDLYKSSEFDKLIVLSSAMHNYPNFITNKYKWDKMKYWDDHVSYYKRMFNDNFLDKYKSEFIKYYQKNNNELTSPRCE